MLSGLNILKAVFLMPSEVTASIAGAVEEQGAATGEIAQNTQRAAQGTAAGPSSWDGYVAAITSDACVTAQEREGEAVAITLPDRPALYS